jgi:hypothetical protein
MQRPTLQNVRITSTKVCPLPSPSHCHLLIHCSHPSALPQDALHVFHAVARNVLPLIVRRLDAEERRAICPGNVYVWEERGGANDDEATVLGMERWTDGIAWGPSRVRDEFLFYQQKEDILQDLTTPSAIWDHSRKKDQMPGCARRLKDPLMKQTYSVFVSFPSDRPHGILRKWHLTAYFSQSRLDELYTVDCIPGIGNVPIPDGWFKSARARKPRRNTLTGSGRDEHSSSSSPSSSLENRSSRRESSHHHPYGHYHPSQHSQPPPAQYATVDMYCQRGNEYPRSPISPSLSVRSQPTYSPSCSVSPVATRAASPTAVRGALPEMLAPIGHLQEALKNRTRDPRDEEILRRLRNTLLH